MARTWLAALAIAVLSCNAALAQRGGGMSYGKAPQAPLSEPDPKAVGIDQKVGEQVPMDLAFRDENDQPITLGECIGGKPTILVLAYYRCPQLCNLVLNELVTALRSIPQYSIGDQFNVMIVSFDPKDRPAIAWKKKQSYLQEYGRPNAENGWHFLTGEQAAIDVLCQTVGFRYEYDKKSKEYFHASGIMILSPEGKISRYFYGIDYEPTDIRFGLADAGEEKFQQTTADKVLQVLCYRWDPHAGKYTPTVMMILRIGAALTMLVLGVWVVRVWRRQRNPAIDAPAVAEAPTA
jgi:protein SCO1